MPTPSNYYNQVTYSSQTQYKGNLCFFFLHERKDMWHLGYTRPHYIWVYLSVRTCELLLCFLAIIFHSSTVLTSQWLLCIHCFMSLMSFHKFLYQGWALHFTYMYIASKKLESMCWSQGVFRQIQLKTHPQKQISELGDLAEHVAIKKYFTEG